MPGFIDGEYQDGELRGCMFIAGIRGMGKTTEMVRLTDQCEGGAIFFDSLSKHRHVLPRYRIISQPGELIEYWRPNVGRRFRVLYQPRSGTPTEHFQQVAKIARAFGQVILAVDELDMHCGARWGDTRMPPELSYLVNYGRHHQVSIVGTARWPTSVSRGFTSQCHEIRIFLTKEPTHIRYFEEYIGQEAAARVRALQKYQYLSCIDGEEPKLCGGRRGNSSAAERRSEPEQRRF